MKEKVEKRTTDIQHSNLFRKFGLNHSIHIVLITLYECFEASKR